MLDRQAVLSRPPELPRLSAPFYKFDRRHVAVRLSQGNVARRSLAPWMLVLLSNPGALWQPAATTCGVSIRTVVLICSCSAVSSRRAPRGCPASALRAYVQVAPARSARTIISVPMLIATKSSFLQLGPSLAVLHYYWLVRTEGHVTSALGALAAVRFTFGPGVFFAVYSQHATREPTVPWGRLVNKRV